MKLNTVIDFEPRTLNIPEGSSDSIFGWKSIQENGTYLILCHIKKWDNKKQEIRIIKNEDIIRTTDSNTFSFTYDFRTGDVIKCSVKAITGAYSSYADRANYYMSAIRLK